MSILKKLNNKTINIIFICILIILTILPFLKIYHEVGILPGYDEYGNFITIRNDYYYSCFQNLKDLFNLTIAIIIFTLLELLLLSSIIVLIIDLKKNIKFKKILLIISMGLFVLVMLLALTYRRCY